jgi:hypothetical protein
MARFLPNWIVQKDDCLPGGGTTLETQKARRAGYPDGLLRLTILVAARSELRADFCALA